VTGSPHLACCFALSCGGIALYSLYRARNLVERFFNKIKQCWRVAARYDKFAANYLAFAMRCKAEDGNLCGQSTSPTRRGSVQT
jgi:hypothetical protein